MHQRRKAERVGVVELGAGLSLEQLNVPGFTARFDLTVFVEDTREGLLVGVEYSRDLFESATIGRMMGNFRALLTHAAAAPTAQHSPAQPTL